MNIHSASNTVMQALDEFTTTHVFVDGSGLMRNYHHSRTAYAI